MVTLLEFSSEESLFIFSSIYGLDEWVEILTTPTHRLSPLRRQLILPPRRIPIPTLADPTLQMLPRNIGQSADIGVSVIGYRQVIEFLPASMQERFLTLIGNLFQRLQAIRGEARTDHIDPTRTVLAQRLHRLVGIRLQPFRLAEA